MKRLRGNWEGKGVKREDLWVRGDVFSLSSSWDRERQSSTTYFRQKWFTGRHKIESVWTFSTFLIRYTDHHLSHKVRLVVGHVFEFTSSYGPDMFVVVSLITTTLSQSLPLQPPSTTVLHFPPVHRMWRPWMSGSIHSWKSKMRVPDPLITSYSSSPHCTRPNVKFS